MSEAQIPVGSHRAPTVPRAYPITTHRLCRNATRMRRKRGYQNLVSTLLISRITFSLQLPDLGSRSVHSSITSLTSGSISTGPTRRVTHDTMKNTRNEATIATADAVTPAGNVKTFQ
jgi:hypothetical protein